MSAKQTKRYLVLGTTPDRQNKKRVKFNLSPEVAFDKPYTLDVQGKEEGRHKVFDLENLAGGENLPYNKEEFDEIHAYEILEHYGRQGDFRAFFWEFSEFWRILKPEGLMAISCPMWDSPWSFADPGHCRVMPKEMFAFLTEEHYEQLKEERNSSCTDYRSFVGDRWWRILGIEESTDQLYIILQKC